MAEKKKHFLVNEQEGQPRKKILKSNEYGKKFWGPYLSDRQWCTVREETNGNCWYNASYENIRPDSYKWGEDGIFGLSDEEQKLCIGLSLWNKKDKVVKERFFGLTGPQGNHGEDVKELYYYLDNDPDHRYMRAVYLYPQSEFPYKELIDINRKRVPEEPEYEILDTGVFDHSYWEIQVEYAKPVNEVVLCKYTITNRASVSCELDLIPQFWFRKYYDDKRKKEFPYFDKTDENVVTLSYDLGKFAVKFLKSSHGCSPDIQLKSADKATVAVRCCATYKLTVPPGGCDTIEWELSPLNSLDTDQQFNNISMQDMKSKTEMFYNKLFDSNWSEEEKQIAKGAWAGLLWNKQYYHYDIEEWYTKGQAAVAKDNKDKPGNWDIHSRNSHWRKHFKANDILSVPDKWEFPWFASWDTCFQMIPFCRLDPEFAKNQLLLLLSERYMSPNGQIPGCEFNFDDNNPPIHAWTCCKVFRMMGGNDFNFLENCYGKLQKNYQWWLKNLQCSDSYTFHGGFLGLDNISVIDRGHPPCGYKIKQADATAWMALFALSMVEIGLELVNSESVSHYPNIQCDMEKYMDDFLNISLQMNKTVNNGGFWNPKMKFYNDVLVKKSSNQYFPIEVKSLVGLLPLVACCQMNLRGIKLAVLSSPRFTESSHVIQLPGEDTTYFFTCVPQERIVDILNVMFEEKEFLSKFGIRSLSKIHSNPYRLTLDVEMKAATGMSRSGLKEELSSTMTTRHGTRGNKLKKSVIPGDKHKLAHVSHPTRQLRSTTKGHREIPVVETMTTQDFTLHYTPGESDSAIMGGNSNWRGPIWMCANYILLDTLDKIHSGIGDRLTVKYSTRKTRVNLDWAKKDICKRLVSIFLPGSTGSRPSHGDYKQYTKDFWREFILYYEYFHGDTGRGCGASHQTGWTALITEILYKLYS